MLLFFFFLFLSPFVSFASDLLGQNSGIHRSIIPTFATDWSITADKKFCRSESVTTKIQHSVQPLFQIETDECRTLNLHQLRVSSMKTAGHQYCDLSWFNALESSFQQDAQKTFAWEAIANSDLNEQNTNENTSYDTYVTRFLRHSKTICDALFHK